MVEQNEVYQKNNLAVVTPSFAKGNSLLYSKNIIDDGWDMFPDKDDIDPSLFEDIPDEHKGFE